mmetsp:Transcript_15507/g.21008  ORF Transcript_15507/g.21008 Transcript_15507/m.21008 type:complete len:226 (-) Transcript_15507:375-1052(-)
MRHIFVALLQLLVPVLAHFALEAVLPIEEAAVFGGVRVHTLEHLPDVLELVGDALLLLLHLIHHAFELLFALNARLILNLLVALVAAAEVGAVLRLSLSAHLILGLLAALFKSNDALALPLVNGPIIQVVQRWAGQNELSTQTREQADARVVQQVQRCDLGQALHERHDVVFVVNFVSLEVQVGKLGQHLELIAVGDVFNVVVRQVECHELEAVFKAFNNADLVV